MMHDRLTSEGEPSSSALPSEPPAPEDCTEAAWPASAVPQQYHQKKWEGKISAITKQRAPESGKHSK